MKLIIVFIFGFITICGYCQVFHVQYYDTPYLKQNETSYSKTLKDSLSSGTWVVYYPSKKEKKTTDNNLIYMVGHYKDSLRNGEFIYYLREDGVHYVYKIETYKDGLLNGRCEKWEFPGKKVKEGTYINGKREGNWIYYNNDIKYTLNYKDDKSQYWESVDDKGNIIEEGKGWPDFMLTITSPAD